MMRFPALLRPSACVLFVFFMMMAAWPATVSGQEIPSEFLPADYETFPVLDYAFQHAELELELNPEALSVAGSVVYRVNARHAAAEELVLHQQALDISEVRINGEEASYEQETGRISVEIPSSLTESGAEFSLLIRYASGEEPALLRTHNGTIFSSLAPFARPQWLPTPEHPRVAFTTDFTLSTPAGMEVVSNGFYDGSESLENDQKRTRWRSEVPVASTQLAFFAGDLRYEENMMGVKSVRVYAEENAADESLRQELLQEVSRSLRDTQRSLRFEYPYDGFSLVVLEDHVWEPKFYAAGIGLAAANSSAIEPQLHHSVAAQWFGAYQRAATVADEDIILLLETALRAERTESDSEAITLFNYPETPGFEDWDRWNPQHRGAWERAFEALPSFQRKTIQESLQAIAQQESEAQRQEDLLQYWYGQTGRMFAPVSFRDANREATEEQEAGISIVNLSIELDREASEIRLIVDPRQPPERDSLYVPLSIYTREGQQERELTVFRTGGEFSVPYEERPRNVAVNLEKLPEGLAYFELKSLDMWLHQLERDPDPEHREAAARMMPRFRDDPDIQLAMQDFLRSEENAEVRTAMIRALSDIVDGDSGTHQIFLEMARTAEGEELQAAVDALWPYEGNSEVKQQISRIVQRSENIGAVVSAISVYRQIATAEEFNTLASSILLSSRPPLIRAAMLEELHRTDNTELAVGTSMDVAEATNFPFALRSRALETLGRFEHYEELEEIMPAVIADADPRLRHQALQQLSFLSEDVASAFREERREKESDPRVRTALSD
jgi:hypothetical protein